jgi:formylmethanofuran dehydrogenase subunit E
VIKLSAVLVLSITCESLVMHSIPDLLETATREHAHLCPRIVLGVRIGMAGIETLGLDGPSAGKRVLTVVECDGCFADGVSAASGCTVGHRTMRVEDYGKVASTFVDVRSGRSIRVAPVLDARERAAAWAPDEPRHYRAQLLAYRSMPPELLLTVTEVRLALSVRNLISRPGTRVNCDACGEEIINEREVLFQGRTLCRACAGHSYYQTVVSVPAPALHEHVY